MTAPALLLLSPLALDPLFTSLLAGVAGGFILPKSLALTAGVSLALMWWTWMTLSRGEFRRGASPLVLAAVLYFVAHAASAAGAKSLNLTLRHFEVFLPYLAIFLFSSAWMNDDRALGAFLKGLSILGTLFAAHGILQYAGFEFLPARSRYGVESESYYRVYSTFGNPVLLAEFLALVLMAALGLAASPAGAKWKPFLLIAAAAMAACLVLTRSRAAPVSLAAAAAVFVALSTPRAASPLRRRAPAALVLLLLAATLFAVLRVTGETTMKRRSIVTRTIYWKSTALMAKDHLLQGVGAGNFRLRYLDYQARFFDDPRNLKYAPYANAEKPNHAHNEYLETAAETGLPGILSLALLLALFVRGGALLRRRENDDPLAAALFCAALVFWLEMSVGVSLHVPSSGALFWALMGAAAARMKDGGTVSAKLALQPRRVKWFAGAIVLMLLYSVADHSYNALRARALEAEGKKLLAAGDFDAAARRFTESLEIDPADGETRYLRGAAHLMLGYASRAVADFRIARMNWDDPILHYNLAMAFFVSGYMGAALDEALTLERMTPAHPLAKRMLGMILRELGNETEADEKFREAFELKRSAPPL
ncbi:MAG: O-antigen ligase family protein [bacterium]